MRIYLLCTAFWLCIAFKSNSQNLGSDSLSIQNLEKAVALSRTQPDSSLYYLSRVDTSLLSNPALARYYEGQGSALLTKRDFDSAVKAFSAALNKLEENSKNAPAIARLLDLIGTTYNSYQRQFDLAKPYFEDALSIRQDYKLNDELNASYYNLGTVHFRKGQHKEAITYFKKALASINGKSQISLAANLNYMTGMSFARIGAESQQVEKFDSAVSYLKSAKEMYRMMDSPYYEGVVAMEEAGLLVELGRYEESIGALTKILNEPAIPKDIQTYVRIYSLLSIAHANLGDFQNAYKFKLLESDSLRKDISDSRLESVAQITEDYRTDKQLDQAEETAFFASRKARLFSIGLIVLAVILLISYLIFIQTLQKKKLENLQAMIMGEEQERKRVAKDLHDGIGVLLTSVKLRLSNFEDKVSDKEAYMDSLQQIDNACSEVRRISHNMVPASLTKLGLAEATLDLLDQVKASTNLKIEEDIEVEEGVLDEAKEVLVYRIVQELINNNLKYAKASTLRLIMKMGSSQLTISYEDDGQGFEKTAAKEGLGLKSIASRVDILKGKLQMSSSPGQGTKFDINIPTHG